MTYESIIYTVEDGVARITLNRPEKHNALDFQLIDELTAAFEGLESDDDVSVVVLAGAGKSFCSGYDLKGTYYLTPPDPSGHWSPTSALAALRKLEGFYRLIWNCPKVTIARVQGSAIAAGCYLQLLCDISIAAASARLGHPVRSGGMGVTSMPLWQTLLSPKKARYLLMSKRVISGRDAERFDLVSLAVPDAELDATVDALANDCRSSAESARYTKDVLNTALEIGGLGAQFRYHAQMNGLGRVLPRPEGAGGPRVDR